MNDDGEQEHRARMLAGRGSETEQEIVPNRWYQAIVMNILKLIKICLLFALFMFRLSELKHYSDYLGSIFFDEGKFWRMDWKEVDSGAWICKDYSYEYELK